MTEYMLNSVNSQFINSNYRWLLLILFWLAWILMFLAAILIVIFSPRCAPKAAPNWWRNAVAYQVIFLFFMFFLLVA